MCRALTCHDGIAASHKDFAGVEQEVNDDERGEDRAGEASHSEKQKVGSGTGQEVSEVAI